MSFNQSLTLNAEDCGVWVFRGVVLIHLGRYGEALQSCDRALALHPKDSEALLFRGVALQRLGRYREAYAEYEHALGRWRQPWRGLSYLKQLWQSLMQNWVQPQKLESDR